MQWLTPLSFINCLVELLVCLHGEVVLPHIVIIIFDEWQKIFLVPHALHASSEDAGLSCFFG
jgi:hypothetical protein